MNEKPEKLIDKKGIRLDGRKADELRPVKFKSAFYRTLTVQHTLSMEKTRF